VTKMHVVDDLAALSLGVLEPDELERIQIHLRNCQSCRAEFEAYQKTVDTLAFITPQTAPRTGLKAQLLARVNQTPSPVVHGQSGWLNRLKGHFQQLSHAWMAFSLVLILALGASTLALWTELRDARQTVNGFHTIAMVGTPDNPDASAVIVVPVADRVGTMVINKLPMLEENQQYQLWLIRGEQRTSAVVFSVDEDGYTAIYLHLPEPVETYQNFGVTIEPAGGSPAPTGERVLSGSLNP
jgi:anti-sigma-K factor RskA